MKFYNILFWFSFFAVIGLNIIQMIYNLDNNIILILVYFFLGIEVSILILEITKQFIRDKK